MYTDEQRVAAYRAGKKDRQEDISIKDNPWWRGELREFWQAGWERADKNIVTGGG